MGSAGTRSRLKTEERRSAMAAIAPGFDMGTEDMSTASSGKAGEFIISSSSSHDRGGECEDGGGRLSGEYGISSSFINVVVVAAVVNVVSDLRPSFSAINLRFSASNFSFC